MPWTFQALSLLLGNLGQAGHIQQQAPSCTPGARSTSKFYKNVGLCTWQHSMEKLWGIFCSSISLLKASQTNSSSSLTLAWKYIGQQNILTVLLVRVSLLARKY